ncbi:MAG: DNA mismatch repair endonuclease MutL [Spirochaetales bacterium]|nr:DNA mismatch repair endonuclease MutL [Spirochaetales bacterium]
MPHAPIVILSEETARRIAAGEVIDRPAAVLRELLDNALDAGAAEITCSLEEGGNARIRVVDDGSGIAADDLGRCALPHATSKIHDLEDMDRLSTLGFRGEALASIAACARLEISSARAGAASGQRLLVEGGKRLALDPHPPRPGTIVDVSRIFFNMPARRRFLKRPQTETALCKATFIEKALAFPNVALRLFSDDELVLYLPPAPLRDRIALAHGGTFPLEFLEEASANGPGFRLTAICARPEAARTDRKYLQIFCNRRRIFEFSLLQAVEYGYTGFLPGGLKPIAFVFAEVDSSLVDFNIHPAKREARFRNLPDLHRALSVLVKGLLSKSVPEALRTARGAADDSGRSPAQPSGGGATLFPDFGSHRRFGGSRIGDRPGLRGDILDAFHRAKNEAERPERAPAGEGAAGGLRYLGQLWRVYLAAAGRDELILVDQHAAHERILFDELEKKPRAVQPLAVPLAFDLEEDEREALLPGREALARLGFELKATGRACEVSALPALLSGVPEADVIAFLKSARGTFEELERRVLAQAACRAAVKAGDELDPVSAEELLTRALALPDPRCPHGRPVVRRFPRQELDKIFQRIV